jgi:hypothetical protein
MAANDFLAGVQDGLTIWHEARDVPGTVPRRIALALFQGTIRFAGGETGTYAGVETIELSDDREPFSGRMTVLLADGSISNQTFEGIATHRESETRLGGTGTWRTVDGSGRFDGLRGGGRFNWSIDGDNYHAEFGE